MLAMEKEMPCNSFVSVITGFLAENNVELVLTLVKNYGKMKNYGGMTLKVHILDSELDNFKEHHRRSTSTRIYWTLKVNNKNSIKRT